MTRDDRADAWLDDSVDELRAMGKKYDVSFETQLIGNRPHIQWTHDTLGVAIFSMALKDTIADDEILGFEYRRDMFLKELSRWIAKHSDSPAEGIFKVLHDRVTRDSQRGTHRFEFKIVTPEWVTNESIEVQQSHQDLLIRLDRLANSWVASAGDFEVMATTRAGHVKRSIKDTWKEAVYFQITPVIDKDDDSLIEDDKRFELFAKAIILPEVKKLLEEGFQIKITDPRLVPASRFIGLTNYEKIVLAVLRHAITRNKTKQPSDFKSSLSLTVIDNENS